MKKIYRTCLIVLAVAGVNVASTAAESDPMDAILDSLQLGSRARVAVVADRGSCEGGELANMLHVSRVVSLERDDLVGPVRGQSCRRSASVQRLIWPSSAAGDAALPVGQSDLIWMAGSYRQLYANLPAPRMTRIVRALATAIGPSGTLVIADRLAPSTADPMKAARDGMMDPQIVLTQMEAVGLRLQSFANDAAIRTGGRTVQPAQRFVMVFKTSGNAKLK